MYIDNFKYTDNWQDVKDATMNTIGKSTGKYPCTDWKRRLILSEHSPIRKLRFSWRWVGLKYWVSVHLVRHWLGIVHFVTTQRSDRTGVNRDNLLQSQFVNHVADANAQALINISRKRLCSCASSDTREAWQMVKDEIAKVEPELSRCMVKDCVYRGHCYEMFSCGFHKTKQFKNELEDYRKGINE